MPVTTSSPHHSHFPHPSTRPSERDAVNLSSQTSSIGDSASLCVESPLRSPTSPMSPSYNFEPAARTPAQSALGAVRGSSQAGTEHWMLKAYVNRALPKSSGLLGRNPLREEIGGSEMSEMSVQGDTSIGEGSVQATRADGEVDGGAGMLSGAVMAEEDDARAEAVNEDRTVVIDFDELCCPQRSAIEVEGGAKVRSNSTSKLPEGEANKSAQDGSPEGHQGDTAKSDDHSSLAPAAPDFVAAFKHLKALDYSLHLITSLPDSGKAEIEAFLVDHGVTVGAAATDLIAAIWHYAPDEAGQVIEILDRSGEVMGAAAVEAKIIRLLGWESNASKFKTLRLIDPVILLAGHRAKAQSEQRSREGSSDADYAHHQHADAPGIAIIKFGEQAASGSEAVAGEAERKGDMVLTRFSGWDGVVSHLAPTAEIDSVQLLRMSQCEAKSL